ncbi:uncharacterized protein LOC111021136 [Momordica charantia]|uniref:Uncharacterized protein LOC111021136 n=1 Tax=Momordica charantia TaxID=3673 RepID=A0A6J1DJT8_MOMCH|nr:uncharacterized protein LOC111021136 [Momordica charantia]
MDIKLQKMQFLGAFGILQEAHKIIFTWRKIFSQITLFFIFPLSLFFLAYLHIFNHMIRNFLFQIILTKTQKDPPKFINLSDLVMSYKWAYLWLFTVAYSGFLSVVSIPSTASVAYAVASIYTGNGEASFKDSLKAVAKVWKRVLVTSFYTLTFSLTYSSVAALVLVTISWLCARFKASIFIVYMVMFFVGSLYLDTIWILSRVVSVLEETYGFKALMKSQRLLRGKMAAAAVLLFFVSSCLVLVQFLCNKVAVNGVVGKGILGILCFVFLVHVLLLKVVVQVELYFICKSYHCENIDMSSDVSGLVGVYVSLKTNDVQLETERLLV